MKLTAAQDATLLEILISMSEKSSKNTLRSWIEKGRVTVDGQVAKRANLPIKAGQHVAVGERKKFADHDIKILYEDKHLIVIDKPEGLLSVATAFDTSACAHSILKRRYHTQKVYPVHRLDRETSGVMLFAYSDEARSHFKELFFNHDIEREYHAVVEGCPDAPTGTWQSYLYEDPSYFVKSVPEQKEAKLGITHYEVLAVNKKFSMLRLKLETGRKNQIRVHCREAGHPIIGDKKYGSLSCSNLTKRLCLHASKLGFKHPATGKNLSFESALPALFLQLIKIKIPV